MRQEFDTVDVLRLEVQDPAGDLTDLVPNGTGELGAWGWITPQPGSRLVSNTGPSLEYDVAPSVTDQVFYTEPIPVTEGLYASARWRTVGTSSTYRFRLEFLDADGAVHASSPAETANLAQTSPTTNRTNGPHLVPAGAVAARLRFKIVGTTAGAGGVYLRLGMVTLVQRASSAAVNFSVVTAPTWTDILGPSHELTTRRRGLDLGTLSATIYSATLDPATDDLLRPGRAIRATVPATSGGGRAPIFTGTVLTARTEYLPLATDPDKRVRIEVEAVDAVRALVNARRPEGVATLDELRAVLEGVGIPWVIDGSTWQTETDPAVVSVNDDATALDQVVLTRDTVLGYAWVDRWGRLNVDDVAPGGTPVAIGSEHYSSLDLDWDSESCINEVSVKVLTLDPVTGETTEATFGPYRDAASVREWGPRSAEFTVHGVADAAVEAHALAILAANATPVVRVNAVTIPLRTTADVAAWASAPTTIGAAGGVDLYAPVEVTVDGHPSPYAGKVTGIEHHITGSRWLTTFTFDAPDSVAAPQVTPPVVTGGRTLAQLLRPVGEVTMFYGAKADCPAGWLVLDGTTFDGDVYPELAAHLGTTLLPDMTDVMPIGAGTKALGTSGGSPTVTLTADNVPRVDGGGTNATRMGRGNTGNVGTVVPVDIMPPWRALWFIIRAK